MRLPGYCTECRRIRQVRVSSSGMAQLARGGSPSGVCADCEEKDDQRGRGFAGGRGQTGPRRSRGDA